MREEDNKPLREIGETPLEVLTLEAQTHKLQFTKLGSW